MENYSIEYGVNQECTLHAFDLYNKTFGRGKIVSTILFSVLTIMFIEQIVREPDNGISWICLAVSVGMLCTPWFTKRMERKSVKSAMEDIANDRYILTLKDEEFTVKTILPANENNEGEENQPEILESVCKFSDPTLKFTEQEKYFGILSKTCFYVIPKQDLQAQAQEKLKEAFASVTNI